jgi:hypothetical protein
MPKLHGTLIKLQFICMLYAGTFFGYTLCHIGDFYFMNAIVGGLADATANATSAILQRKFGLLPCYFTCTAVASISWGCIYYYHIMGLHSYMLVALASFCTGAGLNYATATIIDQTPAHELKTNMVKTATMGAICQFTVPCYFYLYK